MPVTKVLSPRDNPPDTPDAAEAEFLDICKKVGDGFPVADKKEIKWNKKDPLHFWQSLAFVLCKKELGCVGVASFQVESSEIGKTEHKLFITANTKFSSDEQNEITAIINMFLDLKPVNEIGKRILPRHVTYILEQVNKILPLHLELFMKSSPEGLEDVINEFAAEIKALWERIKSGQTLVLDDVYPLLESISNNDDMLKEMKDDAEKDLPATRRAAYRLYKIFRVCQDIVFVWNKVKRHQQNPALLHLSREFEFINHDCHAELAILKTAEECCISKTLYIGVSKRPCYCCSIFLKAVAQNSVAKFKISIVTTSGKLYTSWKRVEGWHEEEYKRVWANVVENEVVKKHLSEKLEGLRKESDNNSSLSGSGSDDNDNYPQLKDLALSRRDR